jgi:hypothetical protein
MKKTHALRAAAAAAVLAAALLAAGCTRYPSAEISGYVKDQALGLGVTGATVRIYLSKPAAADADGAVAETTTAYNGQIPGYFDRKIMWATGSPAFQEQGDTITIWIGVTHPDFASHIVEVPGVLSGGQNIVPDVLTQRTGFSTGSLTGTLSRTAAPAQPVWKIGLDLALGPSESDDYVQYVTLVGSGPCTAAFTFPNIHWSNTSPGGTGFDQKQVKLWIGPIGGPVAMQLPGIWLTSNNPASTTPVTVNVGIITVP